MFGNPQFNNSTDGSKDESNITSMINKDMQIINQA